MLLPLAISYSDDTGHLFIVNETAHYLHLIVEGQPYLYVAPGREIVHEFEPQSQLFARVFYSPGQNMTGDITRTLEVPYAPSETGCAYSSSGGWDCSTTPSRSGDFPWKITPDTMLVADGGS